MIMDILYLSVIAIAVSIVAIVAFLWQRGPQFKKGPMFVKCAHCGSNMYPTETFCPSCGYADVYEVRGWVYTGPAAARIRCDHNANYPTPFRAVVGENQHPADAMSTRVRKASRQDTEARLWLPVAVNEALGRRVMYMIYMEPVDRGKGGHVVERITFMDTMDTAILNIITRTIRASNTLTVSFGER